MKPLLFNKRLLSWLLVASVAGGFYASARSGQAPLRALPAAQVPQTPQMPQTPPQKNPDAKLVYMRADHTYSIDVGDSMAICMVGNFAALHNGAVITCDSAVRYDDKTFECFGNVLINQNTTYIYGDRAEYLGLKNKAEVYSPLIKVVDGDATLYTFQFSFDTYEKVGRFSGGGVLFNRGNQLEAERGYYFTERHEIACAGDVEMRDTTYELTSDSVIYNTDTDRAEFFRQTNIWNEDGDYLYGDRGSYDRPFERYTLTENGYLLTEKQELWSDSLDYLRNEEHVRLYRNIQIDDTEHKVYAFGDYGEYWRNPGNALLTRLPALVSYDTSQGDSLFMRSDTILLHTFYTTQPETEIFPGMGPKAETDTLKQMEADMPSSEPTPAMPEALGSPDLPAEEQTLSGETEAAGMERASSLLAARRDTTGSMAEGLLPAEGLRDTVERVEVPDSLLTPEKDSLTLAAEREAALRDSIAALGEKERKAYFKRLAREKKAAEKQVKAEQRRQKLQEIARARQAKLTAQLKRMEAAEQRRLERRRARLEARLAAKRERAIRRGRELPDSAALGRLDSLLLDRQTADSLAGADSLSGADTLQVDSLASDSLRMADSLVVEPDTVRRIAKGFRNVKIYRTDFQAVCDSIVGIGLDSTLHLYIDPVMWNEENQVSSDEITLFTTNQQLDHADFVGRPIMVSQIDTSYYNQISGKEMTSWFRDNAVYRHDVNGNVETLYFMLDDPEAPDAQVCNLMVLRSGDASFYVEEQQVVRMAYRNEVEDVIYPMTDIPASQTLFLKEYKWYPERRPTRKAVFDRTIRPSVRAEKETLPRPDFPLAERILRYRDRLVDSGRWADRDEEVAYDIREWMRRNGFEPSTPRTR